MTFKELETLVNKLKAKSPEEYKRTCKYRSGPVMKPDYFFTTYSTILGNYKYVVEQKKVKYPEELSASVGLSRITYRIKKLKRDRIVKTFDGNGLIKKLFETIDAKVAD